MGEEFDQWLKLITTEIYMNAWCAGAKAQRQRDVEIARNCKCDDYMHCDCDIVIAKAIENQGVDG